MVSQVKRGWIESTPPPSKVRLIDYLSLFNHLSLYISIHISLASSLYIYKSIYLFI